MLNRMALGFFCLALLIALLAQPALAGGWTVVTLDTLPMNVQSGERVQISFQVQQHGTHPLELGEGEMIVKAWHQVSGQTMQVVANATGEPGHYAAEFVFPADGVWVWEIQPGGFPPAAMPELAVSPTANPPKHVAPASGVWSWWHQVAFQVISYIHRPPTAAPAPVAGTLATDPVDYGKALFVAKGCVTCHVHGQVSTEFSVEVGPNLTTYKVIPEYVEIWLKDPKAIKSETQMPQLQLSKTEIDALIAFLSAGQQ